MTVGLWFSRLVDVGLRFSKLVEIRVNKPEHLVIEKEKKTLPPDTIVRWQSAFIHRVIPR